MGEISVVGSFLFSRSGRLISENLKQIYDSIINSIQTKGINPADLQDLLIVAADGFKEEEQWAK